MTTRLEPVRFDDLAGFDADDAGAAFAAFLVSAKALRGGLAPTRLAREPSPALIAIARAALAAEESGAAA
ncbi:MAG: lytic murein transglycosylase, partial [Hyphomicrobiales bacterium]|nr:lytic murein transglycosylase [Hyphomicrobiales bacterium]